MATDYIGQLITAEENDAATGVNLLSAVQSSPQAGGSLQKALQIYQNGPGNDLPQPGDVTANEVSTMANNPVAQADLAHANASVPGGTPSTGSAVAQGIGAVAQAMGIPNSFGQQAFDKAGQAATPSWLPPDFFPRLAIGGFALIFIVIGLAALALKTDVTSATKSLVSRK